MQPADPGRLSGVLRAGVAQDPVFGPLVAFGPGGVMAELIGDAHFRLTPLTDVDAIGARLDGVGYFTANATARESLREALRRAPDMARALARLSVGRGGPRDLGALRDALAVALSLDEIVQRGASPLTPPAGEVASSLEALAAQRASALPGPAPPMYPLTPRYGKTFGPMGRDQLAPTTGDENRELGQ